MDTPNATKTPEAPEREVVQTIPWRFPYHAPELPRCAFTLRRELPLDPGLRLQLASAGGDPEPGKRSIATFGVERQPAESPDEPGMLHATLTFELSTGEPGGGEPTQAMGGELAAEDVERFLFAADVWVQCFLISDEGSKHLLCRVLGSPTFDGFVATRFLSAQRAEMYAGDIVRLALEATRQDEITLPVEAHAQLTSALVGALDELRSLLLSKPSYREVLRPDGVAAWDARLAGYLERLGQARLAEQLRDRSRALAANPETLWSRWLPGPDRPPLYRLTYAALALWRSKVHPRFGGPTAAVPRGVLTTVIQTYQSRQPLARQQTLGLLIQRAPDGSEVESVDRTHYDKLLQRLRLTSPVTDSVILDALTDKSRATRSMTGQLLLRHLFEVGYRQKVVENRVDFRSYTVQGGLAGLCQVLDRPDCGDERTLLRNALDGFELIRVSLPGSGFDGLLKWVDRKAAPGRKAEVQIVMMDPMLPGYVHSMPQSTPSHREARVLIPIPSSLPPLVGNRATYGAKMLLQMLVMERMAMGWKEYVVEGVHLPTRLWEELADRIELDRKETWDAREAFVKGTNDAQPFLVELPVERYKLAPAHQDAERVILEGARFRTEASGSVRKKRQGKARKVLLYRTLTHV